MKYEAIQGGSLPKIGFGTWKLGGGYSENRATDRESLAALRSAIELGYAHFDTAEMYAEGHTEELLGQAVRDTAINHGPLAITMKVSPEHLDYSSVLTSCEESLRRLHMEYADLYLIHWPSTRMKLADSFRALSKLVGMARCAIWV